MTAAKSLLVPLRFISLMLNIIVAAELFIPGQSNENVRNHTQSSKYSKKTKSNDTYIQALVIIGLTLFELFGLMTGLSLEQDIQGLWSAGLHLISMFLLLFYLMEVSTKA